MSGLWRVEIEQTTTHIIYVYADSEEAAKRDADQLTDTEDPYVEDEMVSIQQVGSLISGRAWSGGPDGHWVEAQQPR